MTLTVAQVARMQCEVQSGATWEQRTAQVPDTAEAQDMWAGLTSSVAEHAAAGHTMVRTTTGWCPTRGMSAPTPRRAAAPPD